MLIRKNTKQFKTIVQIITACQSRPDREKLIRLYITKAGHTVKDRIAIEGIEDQAGLFYDMNYTAVLNNLKSGNHQLHESDELPGIFFFRSNSNKAFDETPFEFDEAIWQDFGSLTDLPVVRKKEKTGKFVIPKPTIKLESKPAKKEKVEAKAVAKKETKKETKTVAAGPKQPDFNLKQNIEFTGLEKIVYRQAKLNKKNVLEYYDKIADYLLPYLKDRPQLIRRQSNDGRNLEHTMIEQLSKNNIAIPDWIFKMPTKRGSEQHDLLFCNDKEHLMFYVEIGCVEFNPGHARIKSVEFPDYAVIEIESPESSLDKAIDVALTAHEVLLALKLPSLVKTNGMSALHIYLPLDSKSKFETSKRITEYICRLIKIKIPNVVALKGSDDNSYGKVILDYLINEQSKTVISPYSLLRGESPAVATPLQWEELKQGVQSEDFNHEGIFKRVKEIGDPFEALSKKKLNGEELLERLELHYSFLF